MMSMKTKHRFDLAEEKDLGFTFAPSDPGFAFAPVDPGPQKDRMILIFFSSSGSLEIALSKEQLIGLVQMLKPIDADALQGITGADADGLPASIPPIGAVASPIPSRPDAQPPPPRS